MAAKYASSGEMENKHDRFLDADQEPRRMLQPIEGYQNLPLLSLEEAVESIVFCCPDIRRRAYIALSNSENPPDGLDQNESASIYLYSMEWEPREECLYYCLNKTLRTENRNKLKPWFLYLKLILTALHKLPSEKETIWRGVALDLSRQYEVGKRYVWWAFSSCTQTLTVLESDQFLGKHGPRTLFNIKCRDGKSIRSHSYVDVEDEILLLPATQFEVKGKLNPAPDLYIIELKQVEPPFSLIELPSTLRSVKPISQDKKKEEQTPSTYRNEKLEQLIAKCSLGSEVDLYRQELTDRDIPIVVQRAIIDKKCSCLHIWENKITAEGAEHLGKVLQSNTSLTKLIMCENRVSDAGVRWIAQALHTNTTLTFLNLNSNEITDEGARFFAEALCVNATLETLRLGKNSIGDSGARHLAQALTRNTMLQDLEIGCNITDKGAQFFAEALLVNSTLESLSFEQSAIGDKGAQHLVQALARNTTLRSLELNENGITDEGIIYLAEILKRNTTLIYLFLSRNPLTNSGVKSLMNALCDNQRLQELAIMCSKITSKCMESIQNMFRLNGTLVWLGLHTNSFSSEEQDQLERMAKEKPNRRVVFY